MEYMLTDVINHDKFLCKTRVFEMRDDSSLNTP